MTATAVNPAVPTLGPAEQAGVRVVAVLAGLLGVIGFVNSFERVEAAVAPSFGSLAWSVPLGIDVGIAVFTGLDLVMSRVGMRLAWLRLVPWALVAVTIYLNVAGEHDPIAVVAHAVLPGLWVVAVEVGAHAVRSWAGITGAAAGARRQRLDRVRLSRWVLAPVSTARLRRRMILLEIVSYHEALAWDRGRRRAKSEMQDTYGRISWRWQAPRRARLDYRLGDLTTATTPDAPAPAALPPAEPRHRPARRKATNTTASAPRRTATADDVLLDAGRRVAARLAREGKNLSRRALVERLRSDEGLAVSSQRGGVVLTRLRDEAAATDAPPAGDSSTAAPANGDRPAVEVGA